MKTTKEMIEVMQAYTKREPIQFKEGDCDSWSDWEYGEWQITWNWSKNDYRIKPKEKKKVKAEWVKTSFSRGSHNEWYITYGIRSFNPVDITPPDFIEIEVEK
jgi:hypothetical protein